MRIAMPAAGMVKLWRVCNMSLCRWSVGLAGCGRMPDLLAMESRSDRCSPMAGIGTAGDAALNEIFAAERSLEFPP